jgi:hypothetical protein
MAQSATTPPNTKPIAFQLICFPGESSLIVFGSHDHKKRHAEAGPVITDSRTRRCHRRLARSCECAGVITDTMRQSRHLARTRQT